MITFKFRPHHLLCCLCFRGKGYNETFVENFKTIHQQLNTNPNTKITIVQGCDDICAKCPERKGALCRQEDKVSAIDKAYLKILQLNVGQTMTFKCLEDKTKKLITLNNFQKACGKCSWYSLNICAPIIQKLVQKITTNRRKFDETQSFQNN